MTDTRTDDMEHTERSTPRQRAIDAYGSARERVSGAGRRAGDALEEARRQCCPASRCRAAWHSRAAL